jgi:hypothetical protein
MSGYLHNIALIPMKPIQTEMTTLSAPRSDASHLFSAPVIVAALGYFVDIYDLLLFGIVRLPSLASLGIVGNGNFPHRRQYFELANDWFVAWRHTLGRFGG